MSIEKVIKGLEICTSRPCYCTDCPYKANCCLDSQEVMEDALALLKEQEAKTNCADSGMCEICSFYERAMSVKPHYNARTNWYECGACHYSMTSGMHCKSELIPAYKVGFCAKCGKAVMWE